jgi:hypothetical protein
MVPALDVPELLHAQSKLAETLFRRVLRACEEKTDHCALGARLGARQQCWQRRRAKTRDKLAPPH